MNYALIGCGRIAPNHIRAARDNKLNIIALCDIDEGKMLKFKENVGLNDAVCYTDYKKLIDENKLDLLSIATDSGSHGKIAIYAIEKGVNVIIEKPMAMSIEEAEKIVELSEKKGVKVCACHQNRFNIAVQQTKKALDEGRFGKISHGAVCVRWFRDKAYYEQDSWRGKWETDGGTLMNQCIHGIDLLRWLMGDEVEVIFGGASNRFHSYIEAEDIGVAVLKFKNGALATVEGTSNAFPGDLEESICIFGEKGTVKLGGMAANKIEMWEFSESTEDDSKNKGLTEEALNVYGNGHTSLYRDVVEAINQNRAPYVDARAGLSALETVLSIYKSQKTGEAVKLPLKNFGTKDMINEL